jgi:threonine/homoserine/homoserine lactone efflux protein
MLSLELIFFTATAFMVGLSGAIVPGPMLTVTISNSLDNGAMAGPKIVLGHIIAEIAIMIIFILGLRLIIGSNIATFIIGTLGGLMLIYMGYKTSQLSKLNLKDANSEKNSNNSIFNGLLTSISNPYFFIWWVTIGWAFLLQGMELAGIVGIMGFIIGHWSADLGFYSAVSVLTSKGSEIIKVRQYKLLMKVCGAFMAILGIYFVIMAQITVL